MSTPAFPMRGGPSPTIRKSVGWPVTPRGTAYTIFVQIGRRIIVVLPDREVDLGVVAEDERIAIQEEAGPGTRKRAIKVKVNDPRIV